MIFDTLAAAFDRLDPPPLQQAAAECGLSAEDLVDLFIDVFAATVTAPPQAAVDLCDFLALPAHQQRRLLRCWETDDAQMGAVALSKYLTYWSRLDPLHKAAAMSATPRAAPGTPGSPPPSGP